MWRVLCTLLAGLIAGPAVGEFFTLSGHGGPIRAVDVDDQTGVVASAGFDNTIGLWQARDGTFLRWLEGHEAAINAVDVAGGIVVSGSDDFTVRVWDAETGAERFVLTGHRGKVQAVKLSGTLLASASWDGRVGLWNVETGEHLAWLEHPSTGVNDVEFLKGGAEIVTAAADGALRLWSVADATLTQVLVKHGFGINRIAAHEQGDWLAYGAVDGGTRILGISGLSEKADLTLERRPILALSISPDGTYLAVGDGEGYIMLVESDGWVIRRDFRAAKRGPLWALAFNGPDAIYAGGLDSDAFHWPLSFGKDGPRLAQAEPEFHQDPDTLSNGARQFYRKCSICHTLSPDGARRAGPTLWRLFGRKSGSLDGYRYSKAMLSADIVWTEETVMRLFEIGPDEYTPGSKMPMQRITAAQDRRDLVDFLRTATMSPTKE